MGFKANDPHLKRMAAGGQLIDQQTGLPLGGSAGDDVPPGNPRWPVADPPPDGPLVELRVTIPGLVLVSEANAHQHHRAEMRRKKAVRAAVAAALPKLLAPLALPVVVTITRVGTGTRPLDDDNLARACKGVRDEIASFLKADDGDRRIRWRYRQCRGWESAVVIRVRQRRPA